MLEFIRYQLVFAARWAIAPASLGILNQYPPSVMMEQSRTHFVGMGKLPQTGPAVGPLSVVVGVIIPHSHLHTPKTTPAFVLVYLLSH
jgi:hypothetical protein